MSEMENEENIKNTIQDTQMLIRNHMQHHKKISKQLHSQIKKEKKTIDLLQEKIAKLMVEKQKLEDKQQARSDSNQIGNPEVETLKSKILQEVEEKKSYDDKIAEIHNDFLTIKSEMGGLNATQALQERYQKHIRILENRLDKANQKFNDSIEYDKKLRAEIDKLRKERYFFENIYKKLEKELEKVRKEISKNLEDAYDNYEQRDINQETFENLKAQMIKKETEYTNILSGIANDLNIRNSRKKSQENKINKDNDDNNQLAKNFQKKIKSEQYEQQQENLNDRYQNLKYKFEKLEEFTEQEDVGQFCEQFKKNVQKNYDLFQTISRISSEAKQLDSEIKEIEKEIIDYKKDKNSQQGFEKINLVSEIKTKTEKLNKQKKQYEDEYKKQNEIFKVIKNSINKLFKSLNCDKNLTEEEELDFKNGVEENNILRILALIEKKLKYNQKVFEYEYNILSDEQNIDFSEPKQTLNPQIVNENMKIAFSNMDMGKIKYMEKIKTEHKDEFKLEDLIKYSEKVAEELLENINKATGDKKPQNRVSKKLKLGE
jgi:hypothetical protein